MGAQVEKRQKINKKNRMITGCEECYQKEAEREEAEESRGPLPAHVRVREELPER